ncbi:carbohydrate ABC transporter permease [Cohnella caldifontis]|uniref:carbohydrate ABC transporter permease n=1 Tax=Cohnella caldifontis TaxID=3027471 RepID=UPI0023ED3E47|nr:carbohydrate ABC transporter permease [Cohnella sp. YIM B05605]
MSSKWSAGVRYLFLMLCALAVLYPILFAFSNAFMTPEESQAYPPAMFPSRLYLRNFADVLGLVPIGRFLLNSLVVSAVIMAGQLVTASLAAYAFAFVPFRGKNAVFFLFLSTMMIPWEVTIIPNYLTVKSWGWMDSYAGLTIPFLASTFGIFLLRQFFLQMPKELIEAARMDGCGHLRVFAIIVLPLARPALATLGVYVFLNAWNQYLWPLLITNTDTKRTVQIGISMLKWEEFISYGLLLAGVSLVLLPSLLLLALGLKQLVRGITAGAVKG